MDDNDLLQHEIIIKIAITRREVRAAATVAALLDAKEEKARASLARQLPTVREALENVIEREGWR